MSLTHGTTNARLLGEPAPLRDAGPRRSSPGTESPLAHRDWKAPCSHLKTDTVHALHRAPWNQWYKFCAEVGGKVSTHGDGGTVVGYAARHETRSDFYKV